MARIRTIKPEFWADEKLAPLPPVDRLVFLGLISQADDAGRLVDNPRLIDGLLFPETEDSSRESLETLERLGRVTRYVSDSGQKIIQVTNWSSHQRVQKPSPHVLPPPPKATAPQSVPTSSGDTTGNTPEEVPTLSGDSPSPTLDLGPTTNDLRPGTNEGDQNGEQTTSANALDAGGAGTAAPEPRTRRSPFDDPPDPSEPTTIHARFMPLLRELHYVADGRDGSVLKALDGKIAWDDIEAAIQGLALLRDRQELVRPLGIGPADALSMLILYARKPTGTYEAQPWWNQAQQAWWKHLERESAGLRRATV